MDARVVAMTLRDLPRPAQETIIHFLVLEFGWPPDRFDQHEAALQRLVQLVDDGQAQVIGFAPSGSVTGDVPDEDDVQELSDLVADEDDAVDARLAVEPPMGIEPAFATEPPMAVEPEVEVADPPMPAFDFEVG